MSGFYGDLSNSQDAALRELKGMFGDMDDHTALRFLRARQFDVKNAAAMYRKYVACRKESGIEKILKSEVPKTDLFKKFVPHAYHGFDRDGRPIYIEKTGAIDYPTAMTMLDDDDFMRHHLYQMEYQIARCAESTARLGKVVDNFCSIVDLTGLNMSHRKALRLIRAVAGHDQDHYPERLGQLFIINAPWVFPTFWRICRVWLDANTVKKIHVLGKNYKKDLAKHIDPAYLPEEYGGTCRCPGGCVPVHDISMYKNGGSIDEELKSANDSQEKTIGSRESFEVKLACGPEGAEFSWAFKIQGGRDILFSVQQLGGLMEWSLSHTSLHDLSTADDRAKPAGGKDKPHEAKPVFIQEPEKLQVNKGSFVSKGATTLIFKFDNTHSYFTSKTLRFLLRTAATAEIDVEEHKNGAANPSRSFQKDLHMDFPGTEDDGKLDASPASPSLASRVADDLSASVTVS